MRRINHGRRKICLAAILSIAFVWLFSSVETASALEKWDGFGTAVTVVNNEDIGKLKQQGKGYHRYWQYWSQGASSYSGFPANGCWMVAQAKLLAESGIASKDSSVFNPDVFFKAAGLSYKHYAPTYAKARGVTLTRTTVDLSGDKAADASVIMGYLRSGYYCIATNNAHPVYIGREASISYNQPIVLNSFSSYSYAANQAHTYTDYTSQTYKSLYVYSVDGTPVPTPTPGPTPTPAPDVCNCSTAYAGQYKVSGTNGGLAINSGHGSSSVGFTQRGVIPEGTVITITKASGYYGKGKSSGNWGHVTYNGISGYCAMNFLEKVDPNPSCSCSTAYAGSYKVSGTNGGLAINSGHGTSSSGFTQLGVIPEGATVQITKATGYNGKGKSSGNWGHVTYGGVSGYCAMNFLVKLTSSCSCSESYAGYYKVMGTYSPDYCLGISSGEGATTTYSELGTIPEGTIVYISKAMGYNGRGKSSGLFGCVTYNGISGHCAMNFLEKQTSYTISFNANGGTVNVANVTVCPGTSDNNSVADVGVSRSNYTFQGWYTASSGGTQVYNASGRYVAGTYWTSGGAYNYNGSVTLYAHWKQNIIYPTSITLNHSSLDLKIGETVKVNASVSPSEAANKNVYWSSDNNTVAAVAADGTITAVSDGTATITCRSVSAENVSAVCSVTVSKIPVIGISMDSEALSMHTGDSIPFNIHVLPENATDPFIVFWAENEDVVQYDGENLVALSNGTTTLWAMAGDDNSIRTSCQVTVYPKAEDIELNRYTVRLSTDDPGTSFPLRGTVLPEDSGETINWSSSNQGVVTVAENGDLKAVSDGRAVVTASITNGPSVSCIVYVTSGMSKMQMPAALTDIEEEALLTSGAERIVVPSGTDTIGSRAFADSGSLRYVLIPNSVTAIADDAFANDSELCIYCGAGSTAEAFAVAHGIPYINDETESFVRVRSITMDSSYSMTLDETAYLPVSVIPSHATDPSLIWSSSAPDIVTVAENGAITAMAPGTAVITAEARDGSGKKASCAVSVNLPDIQVTASELPDQKRIDCDDVTLAADISVTGVPASRVQKAGIMLYDAAGARIASSMETPSYVDGRIRVAWNAANQGVILQPDTAYTYRYAVIASGMAWYSTDFQFETISGYPRIRFASDTAQVDIGGQITLAPIIEYTQETDIIWRSSNTGVAYVIDGEVHGEKQGETVITAMLASDSSVRATCRVSVGAGNVLLTDITLSNAALTLEEGGRARITVTGTAPWNALETGVRWSSSDEAVVIVDQAGNVTAVSAGNAVVMAAAIDGSGVTASCEVTVGSSQNVTVSMPSSLSMNAGTTAALSVTLSPSQTGGISLLWRSSDISVVAVSETGLVTGVAPGRANVTVYLESDSSVNAVCQVTVSAVPVSTISVSPAEENIAVSEVYQLMYSVMPSNATNTGIMWSSSDTGVATVNELGIVVGIAPGTAVISAEAEDGSGVIGSCTITVGPQDSGQDVEEEADCDCSTAYEGYYIVRGTDGSLAISSGHGPSYNFSQLGEIPEGKRIYISAASGPAGKSGNWGHVTYDGITGYCAMRYLTPVTDDDCTCSDTYAGEYIVRGTDGNLAISSGHGPSYNYEEVGKIPEGTKVYISRASGPAGISGNWGHVTYGGVSGYCAMRYLVSTAEINTEVSNVNPEKLAAVLNRAAAWADYTWTAPVDIPVYNNEYGSNHTEYWYRAGTVMHGVPYTLRGGGSKKTMETYAALSDSEKGAASPFSYDGASMWGPKWGGDCTCLGNDCLYAGDPRIGHDGVTSAAKTKAYMYDKVSWNDVAPGDLLNSTGHVMIVTAVSGNNITIVESRGNGSSVGALHCPNKTARAAGGYYVCGTCEYCNGSKKCGAIERTLSKSSLSGSYTPYRYKYLYE